MAVKNSAAKRQHLVSNLERQVAAYVKSICPYEIVYGDRSLLDGLELDIYVPEAKLAIEVNGDVWHSEEHKDKNYHQRKYRKCERAGVRLIGIWESEWRMNRAVCESIIADAFGVYDMSVPARICEVRTVGLFESKRFLAENSLTVHMLDSVRLGLYHGNELVLLMCLSRENFRKNKMAELLQLCPKKRTHVFGGFGKLLDAQPFNALRTYVDLSKSDIKAYTLNGFEPHGGKLSYKYFKHGQKGYVTRFDAQKFRLKKLLGDGYDPKLNEVENMAANGYVRQWDFGNLKMEWKRGDRS